MASSCGNVPGTGWPIVSAREMRPAKTTPIGQENGAMAPNAGTRARWRWGWR